VRTLCGVIWVCLSEFKLGFIKRLPTPPPSRLFLSNHHHHRRAYRELRIVASQDSSILRGIFLKLLRLVTVPFRSICKVICPGVASNV
jgi:hypothetical protein